MVKKSFKRWISGATVAGMMFSMLMPMGANAAENDAQISAVDYSKLPKLMITELVPDTANIDGADAYEFVEVYNNSNQTIDFNQYNLVYRVSGADTVWAPYQNGNPGGTMLIPAQSSIVLWVMNDKNKGLSANDFNTNFLTNLQMNVNLYRVEGGGGMHNSAPRDLVIQEKTGSDISIASYQNDNQTKPNKGIFYRFPSDGSKKLVMYGSGEDTTPADATPGAIDPSQVPSVPRIFSQAPAIIHTPVTQADQKQDLVLKTQVTNAESNETVSTAVYYQMDSQTSYDSLPMTVTGSNQYQAVIPKANLTESQMKYYIQTDDGFSTVRSNVYSVAVAMDQTDYSKVPPLMVTEVVPDSTNVGSADGYEFIEVYNNTDKTINFKDYKVVYRYTDSGPDADVPWPADKEDMLIPSKGSLVFWIINNQNMNSTVADFNANYGTNLVDGTNIVRIHSDGMANGSNRGLVIATNTGIELSASYYVNGDSKANKGIVYKFPATGSTMIKSSAGTTAATPGTVTADQVPPQTVKVTTDTLKPTLKDLTKESTLNQALDLEIIGEAKDETSLKTVALYYKTDKQSQYNKRYLKESFADTLYHYMIYSPELIGNSYVDYYFTASDGTNETITQTKRVQIQGGSDHSNLRLNVKDGDIVSQTKVLKGTGEGVNPDSLKLAIDGTELTQSTYHAVEHDAFFAFEVMGVNYYFKNGITQGQEILSIFQDPINSYKTLSIPLKAERLKEGSNAFQIRAGSKASPFDDRPEENKDNFEVKNVRLVFADGTVVYDAKYSDPNKVIKIGDSSGLSPVIDFNFVIPSTQLASKAHDWNTTLTSDGDHKITVSETTYGTVTSNIKVDNTAPVVVPSIEDGKMYRGSFTIDANVTDALAGVDKVEATLDEQPVTLPLATSSAQLPGGAHVFNIKATDKVGNLKEVTIHFEVPNEAPDMPELIAPSQGASGVDPNASLSVKVTDPMNDDLKVTFKQGFKYDGSTQGTFSGYRGAADTEPPKQEKPASEAAMTPEDYGKINSVDGNYLTDDAVEKFPYQRFEIALDPAIQSTDEVVIDWKGKSLEGRKVSLYAWSPSKLEWTALKTVIAGNEDFELKASVQAGDYANNSKLQVMVQDEIATVTQNQAADSDYDFSFVWMSDTQYYSKSYPYIYQKMVKWISDHKEDNKIKYVIHTGDIVDNADQEYQWIEADKDMKVLETAGIPYGVLAGNHDVGHQDNDYSYYSKWFGDWRFKDQPTYGESYDNNKGHYDLVSSNGNDFIIVYMGWGYGDKEIDWINEVLKKYPNRKAILNFHEFMLVSNNRAPMAEKVFERVIKPNKNVIAALSGHYHDAELKVDPIDDNNDGVPDRNVYQMLADYQGAPEGGLGYMRLMQFDLAHGKINMKTYSPHLDDYNFYDPAEYPGKDEFSLDLNLDAVTKRVATDYIGVNVYTNQTIGSAVSAKSGENASVMWPNLAQNTTYQWYALAEDQYGGSRQSDIWKFTTKTVTTDPSDSVNDLSGLSLSTGNLNEPFEASKTNYTQSVANNIESVKVTPTAAGAEATVKVNGVQVASGQESSAIPLQVGENTITVVVTAKDNTSKIYTIVVTRLSNNALLINMTTDKGTLSPAFTPTQSDYSVDVAYGVTSLNLNVTKDETHQKLTVTGAEYSSVSSNVYTYTTSNLVIGSNPVQVEVTAQDGTKNSYKLTVKRAADTSSDNDNDSDSDSGSGSTSPTVPVDTKVTSTDGKLTLPVGSSGEVSYENEVIVSIPADASLKELKLTIEKLNETKNLLTNNEVLASPIYEILKNFSENFNKAVTLTFTFDPASLKGDQRAAVFYYDEVNKLWVEVEGGKVNGNHISVEVNHFTKYAVMAVGSTVVEPTTPAITLKDIKGHWAENNILELVKAGSINGYEDGTFKPENRITRAEFVSIVVKFLKLNEQGSGNKFADAANHWAKNAIATAAAQGIITGYTDTTFGPDDFITREQMAEIIVRAAHLDKVAGNTSFTDNAAISDWAQAAVATLTSKGFMNGYEDGTLKPQGLTTRAEASTLILRTLNK